MKLNFKVENSFNLFESLSSVALKSLEKKSSEIFSSILEKTHWMINERGGIAKIAGWIMVPSQFSEWGSEVGNQEIHSIIKRLPSKGVQRLEQIEISGEHGIKIQAVIIYPQGWDPKNNKCTVYNNPNAITVPEFLSEGFDADSTPFHILKKTKCPLIMYDYRGTGINRAQAFNETPSVHTISVDGHTVLNYAMKNFKTVDVWGSSLGGGVATVACEAYLTNHPSHVKHLRLYNHDSFTTTGKVVLPAYLNCVATLLGGNLDAETAMRKLASRGLETIVLYHRMDPIIRSGSRMAEILPELKGNITLIESPHYGHANLSSDMIERLYSM